MNGHFDRCEYENKNNNYEVWHNNEKENQMIKLNTNCTCFLVEECLTHEVTIHKLTEPLLAQDKVEKNNFTAQEKL